MIIFFIIKFKNVIIKINDYDFRTGDVLQSISLEHNSFSFLANNELPSDTINVERFDKMNLCRRFANEKLKNFVNSMVSFEKYSLPNVQIAPDKTPEIYDNPLNIFYVQFFYYVL
jgi:hypothetical protein